MGDSGVRVFFFKMSTSVAWRNSSSDMVANHPPSNRVIEQRKKTYFFSFTYLSELLFFCKVASFEPPSLAFMPIFVYPFCASFHCKPFLSTLPIF